MLVWCAIFLNFLTITEAQYDDVRCKCVCPRDILKNNVVIKFVKVENCKCKNLIDLDETSCLLCKCQYEARNTTLIKVVVIFIVVVLIILIVYMIGLWLYSFWKPESLSVQSDVLQQRLIARSRALTRLDSTVSKWKDSVQDQRRNVYDHHSMLS